MRQTMLAFLFAPAMLEAYRSARPAFSWGANFSASEGLVQQPPTITHRSASRTMFMGTASGQGRRIAC
jgi:hypothetical protein